MYTYLIGWRQLDKWYYGSRVANKKPPSEDLFCEYFTSSRIVKTMVKRYGLPDVIRIHKVFDSKELCREYEVRFLNFVGVCGNPRWLNENNAHAPPILYGEKNGFFGKTHSAELKEKWKNRRYVFSEETKQKMRGRIPWNKGVKGCHSEETLQKIKLTKANNPIIVPWNKGVKGCHSEETLQKMSKAKKGKPGHKFSEESIAKISQAKTGKKWFYDEKTKECVCSHVCPEGYKPGMIKKTNGRTGYKHSEETRKKMSVIAKNRKNNDSKEN